MILQVMQRVVVSVRSCNCGLFRLSFEGLAASTYAKEGVLRPSAGSCPDPLARQRTEGNPLTGKWEVSGLHRWHPQQPPDVGWFSEALEVALRQAMHGYVEGSAKEVCQ